jgi:hypothetical protein
MRDTFLLAQIGNEPPLFLFFFILDNESIHSEPSIVSLYLSFWETSLIVLSVAIHIINELILTVIFPFLGFPCKFGVRKCLDVSTLLFHMFTFC